MIMEYKNFLKSFNLSASSIFSKYIEYEKLNTFERIKTIIEIINLLLDNSDIMLHHIKYDQKQDFIDAIENNKAKYLLFLDINKKHQELDLFEESILKLKNHIKSTQIQEIEINNINSEEIDILEYIISEFINCCKVIFISEAYIYNLSEKMLSIIISFKFYLLKPKELKLLYSNLLYISEMLYYKVYDDNNLYILNSEFIDNLASTENDVEDIFYNIVDLYINKLNIIENFDNQSIINLYNKLKNIEINNNGINIILEKLYEEAYLRYNFNKLDDNSYDLMNYFQSYHDICNQILVNKMFITEIYLYDQKKFFEELCMIFSQHMKYIKYINITKIPVIQNLIYKLESEHIQYFGKDINFLKKINNIKNHLNSTNVDIKILNNLELSVFDKNNLKIQYHDLFGYIHDLIENQLDNQTISSFIIKKIAQDYYINNSTNSLEGLRNLLSDKKQIEEQLSFIDFAILLKCQGNKISTMLIRKYTTAVKFNNIIEYMIYVLKYIVNNSTIKQLNILYKLIIHDNLTGLKKALKKFIIIEIDKRNTFSNTIISFIKNKKEDYTNLQKMKKSLKQP